jgi:arylformamidase
MGDSNTGERRFVDLSHPIVDGMTTCPGLPPPHICDFLSRTDSRGRYAPGVSFQIGRIDMIANTGTCIDSPFHRFEDGAVPPGVRRMGSFPVRAYARLL